MSTAKHKFQYAFLSPRAGKKITFYFHSNIESSKLVYILLYILYNLYSCVATILRTNTDACI